MVRALFSIWIAFTGFYPVQALPVCRDCADQHAVAGQTSTHSRHLGDCLSSDGQLPCDCDCHRFSDQREPAIENAGWSPLRYRPDARSINAEASAVRADQGCHAQIELRMPETRGRPVPRLNALLCTWLV